MDEYKMVLRCMETFQAGYDADKKLVEINWISWNKKPTPEIRCVFIALGTSLVRCNVYSSISGTYGVDLDTERTWELLDPILFREKQKEYVGFHAGAETNGN